MNTSGYDSWDIGLIPSNIYLGGRWFDCAIIAEAGPWQVSAFDSSELLTMSDGSNSVSRTLPPNGFPRIVDRHSVQASYLVISKEDYIWTVRSRGLNDPINLWIGGYISDAFDVASGDEIRLSHAVATDILSGPYINETRFPTITLLDGESTDSLLRAGRDGSASETGRIEVVYSPLYMAKMTSFSMVASQTNFLVFSAQFDDIITP